MTTINRANQQPAPLYRPVDATSQPSAVVLATKSVDQAVLGHQKLSSIVGHDIPRADLQEPHMQRGNSLSALSSERATVLAAAPRTPTGAWIAKYYKNNYWTIKNEVKKFHRGSYGCAAYASTALKMAGVNVRQVKSTNQLANQLDNLGWRWTKNMGALKPGDVVFTDPKTSNLDGTYSHVYIFQRYDGPNYAIVTDNYGREVRRNIGRGRRSRSVIAYRPPS